MRMFNTIMEKRGLVKDKAVEAVAGTEAAAAEAPASAETAAPEVSASEAPQTVDVIAVCEEIARKNGANLNWKTSIVDLMKLLGIDSSLANRKALAEELGCPKDLIGGDYTQMNVWLHKAVMQKLAENGGKVPADLTK